MMNDFGNRLDDWRQKVGGAVNAFDHRDCYDGIHTLIELLTYPSDGHSEARCSVCNLQSVRGILS